MKAKTILIIDDDEKVLEAIKDVLETESYVVNTAGNGISGIRSRGEPLVRVHAGRVIVKGVDKDHLDP